jgi:glutamyl-tRNA synthetase/glutamyl-Q tRNA(Asp) synthetase
MSGAALALRLAERVPTDWRTRFAPAPTGWLHLGHAVNAIYVWGLARAVGGRVLVRIEDHDRGRCRPEYDAGVLDDLEWIGLAGDRDAPAITRQSDRGDVYARALGGLVQQGLVYPCACSRRDVAAAAGEGDAGGAGVEVAYPGTCARRFVDARATSARRVRLEPGNETFDDVALGSQCQTPAAQCGDLLARDRSGSWTYHFAVTVDDLEQGIDVVIRGSDLLSSTARQLRLARLLGRSVPPVYLHHPLILRPDGSKLSKSDGDTGLRDLRRAGWTPARVLGEAARLAGLQSVARSIGAEDLGGLFTSGSPD